MTGTTGNRIGVAVLGSTGSVGTQTLDVVRSHPERFNIVALAAGTNVDLLEQQIHEFRPAIASHQGSQQLAVPSGTTLIDSDHGLVECASHPDVEIVVVATSGIASLAAVMAAADLGKTIALANKEALVCAADVLLPKVARTGAELRPVDSEHSAIWQCMGSRIRSDLRSLTLTASGGPFRDLTTEQLAHVTVQDALNHPTWAMGSKITIDSATLVNKGLEVIEAHHLFDVPYDAIHVLVHPESIVHSLVEFMDGSTLAQLSNPDMRLPIQWALSTPDHLHRSVPPLDLASIGNLTFENVDRARFPALDLCIEAGRAGSARCIALCAADEVAVKAFLDERITYIEIHAVLAETIERAETRAVRSLEDVEDLLRAATAIATRVVEQRS